MVVVKWGSFPLTTGLRPPLVHFPARNAQRKGTVFCQVRLSVWDRLPIAGALTLGQSRFSCGLGRAGRRGPEPVRVAPWVEAGRPLAATETATPPPSPGPRGGGGRRGPEPVRVGIVHPTISQ